MIIAWGEYRFQVGDVQVAISRQNEYTGAETAWAFRERWKLSIDLFNREGDLGAMTVKLAALESAFASDGRDLRILSPSGGTTQHKLLTKNCLGGTRVVMPPSYPRGTGPEYITTRTVEIEVEGLIPYTNPATVLRSFTESVQFSGGGQRRGCIETLTGSPQDQIFRRQSAFRAIQAGSAVGIFGYPTIPAAIWPAALAEDPVIEPSTPRRVGSDYMDYGVTWRYVFESSKRLVGAPNIWI